MYSAGYSYCITSNFSRILKNILYVSWCVLLSQFPNLPQEENISGVDYCLITACYINCVKSFEVDQNTDKQSDHTFVTLELVINAKFLLQRVQDNPHCRKPVPFMNIEAD